MVEHLIQAATVTTTTDISVLIWGLIASLWGIVLSVLYWVARTTRNTASIVDRLLVVVFGYNGDNGLNGDVKACKKALEDHIKEKHL